MSRSEFEPWNFTPWTAEHEREFQRMHADLLRRAEEPEAMRRLRYTAPRVAEIIAGEAQINNVADLCLCAIETGFAEANNEVCDTQSYRACLAHLHRGGDPEDFLALLAARISDRARMIATKSVILSIAENMNAGENISSERRTTEV